MVTEFDQIPDLQVESLGMNRLKLRTSLNCEWIDATENKFFHCSRTEKHIEILMEKLGQLHSEEIRVW